MKKSVSNNWISALLALLFALLLFFNANAQLNLSTSIGTNATYDETVYNVPVQVNYDKDKYFVSGYEETVTVHLSSANRIQLNMEANEETRKFQVVADLTKTALGTSEVKLTIQGLSTAVTAEIDPGTITVTMENKVTKTVDVQAQLPASMEAEGYSIENAKIMPKTVEITTGEETAKAITKVVAPLSDSELTSDTVQQSVNVEALDSKGQVLSIEKPAPQVKVVAALAIPSKEVGLAIKQSGTALSSVSQYSFTLSEKVVEIKGPRSVIATISTIEIPIDITDITTTTTKNITIPVGKNYSAVPTKIQVTVVPVYIQSSDTYTSTSQQTTSASYGSQNSSGQANSSVDQSQSSSSSQAVESSSSSSAKESVENNKNSSNS